MGALGSTTTASGGYQSSSTGYFGNNAHSVNYGCHGVNISGNIPIIPPSNYEWCSSDWI